MAKVKCPSLLCNGIGVPVTERKKVSVTKAAIGATIGAAINPVGAVIGGAAGALNGKKKVVFMCPKCGKTWTQKV